MSKIFIAEIGINHNGDINLAKQLIDIAKRTGADVVKFQKRDLDICIPKSVQLTKKDTPWGEMTYREYKEKIEFEKNEFNEIDQYCKEVGIKWAASVWDIPSLEFICQYDIPFIKIPSACITDTELLESVTEKNKQVIISIGMSTEGEINNALEILKGCPLTIMHCNSSYPAADNELDLSVIQELINKYSGYTIGYSGHESGIMSTIIAVALGAKVVERHITIDKSMWGTDQKASLDERQLEILITNINNVPVWLGEKRIKVYDSEEKVKTKLRRI